MSETDAGAPPPKSLTPSNMREWITAISAVGTLLVGVVGVSATMRIDGIEDYLQSEIALRNRQVVQAEDRVEAAKGENESLRQQRERATAEANFSQRQLTYNNFQAVVSRMNPAGAHDGFLAQYENPPRPLPAVAKNPGAELLDRVINHYRDSEDPHELALTRRLRSRCAPKMNTPLQLEEVPAALPMPTRSDAGARAESYEQYAAAMAKRQESAQAFSEAEQRRSRAIREAHTAATEALLNCALDILNDR